MRSLRLERPRFPRPLRARPQAEPLEGRSLLSHVLPRSAPQTLAIHVSHVSPRSASQTLAIHAIHVSHVSPRLARQTLAIQVPSAFIGPGTSDVDVTLTRSSPAGAAGLRKRLTVWFSDSYESIPADPSAPGGFTIVGHPGVSKNFTFQPGQASLTIPVPVPAVPAGFGSVDVVLGVQLPIMSFRNWPITTSFTVFASANKVPPTIVATRLTPQGLALTFSKAMDASTVQNINNYDVVEQPTDVNMGGSSLIPNPEPVTLQAAIYDPTTQTVTLIPTKPLDLASVYTVSSRGGLTSRLPASPGTQFLTDLEGNAILEGHSIDTIPGSFSVHVSRDLSTLANWSVPGSI